MYSTKLIYFAFSGDVYILLSFVTNEYIIAQIFHLWNFENTFTEARLFFLMSPFHYMNEVSVIRHHIGALIFRKSSALFPCRLLFISFPSSAIYHFEGNCTFSAGFQIYQSHLPFYQMLQFMYLFHFGAANR